MAETNAFLEIPAFLRRQDSEAYKRYVQSYMDPATLVKGCEAVACKSGYAFVLKNFDECNVCTVNTLREMFGHCELVRAPDDGGVLAVVRGTPYVWFAEYPEHCTC